MGLVLFLRMRYEVIEAVFGFEIHADVWHKLDVGCYIVSPNLHLHHYVGVAREFGEVEQSNGRERKFCFGNEITLFILGLNCN